MTSRTDQTSRRVRKANRTISDARSEEEKQAGLEQQGRSNEKSTSSVMKSIHPFIGNALVQAALRGEKGAFTEMIAEAVAHQVAGLEAVGGLPLTSNRMMAQNLTQTVSGVNAAATEGFSFEHANQPMEQLGEQGLEVESAEVVESPGVIAAHGNAEIQGSSKEITKLIARSQGAPLPPALMQRVSAALGHDMSHARIHTDSAAAKAAEDLNAHAFALGADVFFGGGEYAPNTRQGMHLLLHELTHVKQHDEGRLNDTGSSEGLSVSSPSDATELEAESVATRLTSAVHLETSVADAPSGADTVATERETPELAANQGAIARTEDSAQESESESSGEEGENGLTRALRQGNTIEAAMDIDVTLPLGPFEVGLKAKGALQLHPEAKLKPSEISFSVKEDGEDMGLSFAGEVSEEGIDLKSFGIAIGSADDYMVTAEVGEGSVKFNLGTSVFSLGFEVTSSGEVFIDAGFDVVHLMFAGALKAAEKSFEARGLAFGITSKFDSRIQLGAEGSAVRPESAATTLGGEIGTSTKESEDAKPYGVVFGGEVKIKSDFAEGGEEDPYTKTEGSAKVYMKITLAGNSFNKELSVAGEDAGTYLEKYEMEKWTAECALEAAFNDCLALASEMSKEGGSVDSTALKNAMNETFAKHYATAKVDIETKHLVPLWPEREDFDVYVKGGNTNTGEQRETAFAYTPGDGYTAMVSNLVSGNETARLVHETIQYVGGVEIGGTYGSYYDDDRHGDVVLDVDGSTLFGSWSEGNFIGEVNEQVVKGNWTDDGGESNHEFQFQIQEQGARLAGTFYDPTAEAHIGWILQREGSGAADAEAAAKWMEQSSGRELSAAELAEYSAKLGADLSGAMIHTDAAADQAARAAGAEAVTVGRHVYFRAGNFSPDTAAGSELLAHELMHVSQFNEGRVESHGEARVSDPSGRLEAEAKSRARAVTTGSRANEGTADSSPNHTSGSSGAVRGPASRSGAVADPGLSSGVASRPTVASSAPASSPETAPTSVSAPSTSTPASAAPVASASTPSVVSQPAPSASTPVTSSEVSSVTSVGIPSAESVAPAAPSMPATGASMESASSEGVMYREEVEGEDSEAEVEEDFSSLFQSVFTQVDEVAEAEQEEEDVAFEEELVAEEEAAEAEGEGEPEGGGEEEGGGEPEAEEAGGDAEPETPEGPDFSSDLPEPEPASVPDLQGTPDEMGVEYQSLAPSVQASVHDQLSTPLTESVGKVQDTLVDGLPEIEANQSGVESFPDAPEIQSPDAESTEMEAAGTPEVTVEGTPVQESPDRISIGSASEDDAAAAARAIGQAIGSADSSKPNVSTDLVTPEIPLEGDADPAKLDQIADTAVTEGSTALQAAQSSITDIPDDLVAPVAVNETVEIPEIPAMETIPEVGSIEPMKQLDEWDLSAVDQAAFDEQVGDELKASLDEAQAQLDQGQAELDTGYADLLVDADSQAAEATASAQQEQQAEITGALGDLASEQTRVQTEQQAALDETMATMDSERMAARAQIDDRVATDRAALDTAYAQARDDADTAVAMGEEDAAAAQSNAESAADEDNWWDFAIDAWQAAVQEFADLVADIWTTVTELVTEILDTVVALATELINGLVSFISEALTAYYDMWKGLIQGLLGEIFPELADALCAWIDQWQEFVLSTLNMIAEKLVEALETLAAWIVEGMNMLLAAYQAYVAFYISLLESIQQGEWADVGKMLLTALLQAAGIDPDEFFGMFGQVDEIIDEVIANPGGIAMNAAEAIGLGFEQFGGNFISHFIGGAVEWLTGAENLEMPDTFDIAGVFDVTCQVLGLTYDNLREKAVEHVGEGAVTAAEKLYEGIMAFLDGGWGGLWEYVQGQLMSLVDDVIIAIGSWLVEKAIVVAGRWIAGLIATAGLSAIVEALIAAWQFMMWVIDEFQSMYAIVQSTIDSVHDFVMGDIQPAADKIELTLADMIPPAIDLVAKLLNISNISDKVQEVVESVREMIDNAIDALFETLLESLGLGEDEEEGEGEYDGEIGEEISFSAAGEGHRQWIQGETPMVASTPMPVTQRLSDWSARKNLDPSEVDGEGGPTDKSMAGAQLDSADDALTVLIADINEAVEAVAAGGGPTEEGAAPDTAAEQADNEVESDQDRLVDALGQLFTLYQDESPEPALGDPVSFTGAGGDQHTLAIGENGKVTIDGGDAIAAIADEEAASADNDELAADIRVYKAAVQDLEATAIGVLAGEDASTLEADKMSAKTAAEKVLGAGNLAGFEDAAKQAGNAASLFSSAATARHASQIDAWKAALAAVEIKIGDQGDNKVKPVDRVVNLGSTASNWAGGEGSWKSQLAADWADSGKPAQSVCKTFADWTFTDGRATERQFNIDMGNAIRDAIRDALQAAGATSEQQDGVQFSESEGGAHGKITTGDDGRTKANAYDVEEVLEDTLDEDGNGHIKYRTVSGQTFTAYLDDGLIQRMKVEGITRTAPGRARKPANSNATANEQASKAKTKASPDHLYIDAAGNCYYDRNASDTDPGGGTHVQVEKYTGGGEEYWVSAGSDIQTESAALIASGNAPSTFMNEEGERADGPGDGVSETERWESHDRAHVVADEFCGSPQGRSYNLITTSSTYNATEIAGETMRWAETEIGKWLNRDERQKQEVDPDVLFETMDLDVEIEWGEPNADTLIQAIYEQALEEGQDEEDIDTQALSEIHASSQEAWINYQAAHPETKIQRVLSMNYSPVASYSDGSTANTGTIFIGPDKWVLGED